MRVVNNSVLFLLSAALAGLRFVLEDVEESSRYRRHYDGNKQDSKRRFFASFGIIGSVQQITNLYGQERRGFFQVVINTLV